MHLYRSCARPAMAPTFRPLSLLPRWRSVLVNLTVIICLAALAGYTAYQSRLHYLRLAELSVENLTQALAKHMASVIEKADVSLRTVAMELDDQMAKGEPDAAALNRHLARQLALQPDFFSLRATDAKGMVRYGDGVVPGNGINLADRDYFLRLRDDPDAGLVISQPYLGRMSNQWVIILARRLNGPDGDFAGVVFVTITIEHINDMLSSLDLGPNGVVALQMDDLRLITRIPAALNSAAIGSRLTSEAFEASLQADPQQGSFTTISPIDHVERTLAYRRVPGQPLYVVAGRATKDFLGAWWDEVYRLAAIVMAFGGLTLWLLMAAARSARRKEAARQLLQEAVESIDSGFAIFDQSDRLVICNDAYRNFHPASRELLKPGISFEELLRHKAVSGRYPDAAKDPEKWVADRLEHRRSGNGTPLKHHAADDRHFLTIEHRTPNGYTACNQVDITDLVRANEALIRSNIELQHFAHAAAHDLQTPLRSISGFAALLRNHSAGSLEGQADDWLKRIIDETARLHRLIEELLTYTRLEAQARPFEPADLGELFDQVQESLAPTISEARATVSRGDLPTLKVDRTQVGLLFQNLIENGIKYNESAEPRVHVEAERLGDEWRFAVTDNGIGIAPRYQKRIFEIFRRLHAQHEYPGSGIGLAICQRVIEQHGGQLWVESDEGAGSTFRFTLPAAAPGDAI